MTSIWCCIRFMAGSSQKSSQGSCVFPLSMTMVKLSLEFTIIVWVVQTSIREKKVRARGDGGRAGQMRNCERVHIPSHRILLPGQRGADPQRLAGHEQEPFDAPRRERCREN